MLLYLQLSLIGLLAIAVSSATTPADASEVALPTAAKIREVWTQHAESMGPIVLHAELTEEIMVKGRPFANDPYETRRVGREEQLIRARKTIALKQDGRKSRTAVSGAFIDLDSGRMSQQQQLAGFDGRTYKRLSAVAGVPLWLGSFGGKETVLCFTHLTTEFRPLEQWSNPLVLLRRSPNKNIQISDDSTFADDKALKLTVVEQGRVKVSVITSRSQPYLPLQYTSYRANGKEYDKCRFSYSRGAKAPTRLASWHAVLFDEDGNKWREFGGRVTSLTCGKPISAEEFDLSFPVGTHITEYVGEGRRTWIQTTPTEMKSMKESDLGKLPANIDNPVN